MTWASSKNPSRVTRRTALNAVRTHRKVLVAAASACLWLAIKAGAQSAALPDRHGRNTAATPESPDRLPRCSLAPPVLLPDTREFTTWEAPAVRFTRSYFVNVSHPLASDANPGTEARPFATINRAAQVLQPGERVVVGPGIYRERIRPARGGSGPTQLISYEAQPGVQVILRGSRLFVGPWTRGQGTASNVWSARLNEKLFDGYRPFAVPNVTEEQFMSMDWAQPQRGKVPFTIPGDRSSPTTSSARAAVRVSICTAKSPPARLAASR